MLSFICNPCKEAGTVKASNILLTLEAKRAKHANCLGGTHCECQHRVGKKNV